MSGHEPSADCVVCSTGTMPRGYSRRYHDIDAVFQAMADIPVRDIELVLHPDWRPEVKPRTSQPDPWEASPKWETESLIEVLKSGLSSAQARVHSIHANRDLGIFLGADNDPDRELGTILLQDNCEIAEALGARIVVVHAWDTWTPTIEPGPVARALNAVARRFTGLTLSVENIPVSARGWSQAALMKRFAELLDPAVKFTLDLSWSSLYGNLEQLLGLVPRSCNVHVQGRLRHEGGELRLVPRAGKLDIGRAITKLRGAGYTGQWTLELNRARTLDDFRQALHYLHSRIG